jgi:hypothetical protein
MGVGGGGGGIFRALTEETRTLSVGTSLIGVAELPTSEATSPSMPRMTTIKTAPILMM